MRITLASFLTKSKRQFTNFSCLMYPEISMLGIFVLVVVCVGFPFVIYFSSLKELTILENDLLRLHRYSCTILEKDREYSTFREWYRGADPAFLENCLSTIPLMEKEREVLRSLEQSSFFAYPAVVKKAQKLQERDQLRLVRIGEQISPQCVEAYYRLQQPVEVSIGDVDKILSLIEKDQKPMSRKPQLIIKKFSLEKHDGYWLDLELIQRIPREL